MTRRTRTPRPKSAKKVPQFQHYGDGKGEILAIVVIAMGIVLGFGFNSVPQDFDESDLRVVQARIDEFMILHGSTPKSSAELKAYLNSEKYRYRWYGNDGIAAEYVRIGAEYYLLQRPIPGEKAEFEHSPSVYRLPKILSNNMQENLGQIGFYPAPLLLGIDSPDQQFHARVLLDQESFRRFLVVTDNTRIDRAWVAPHEFVEEFFWLPSGHRLVYSATSSARYDDGIYLWHPQSNRSQNLLRDYRAQSPNMVSGNSNARSLSLVGLSETHVYVIDHPQLHKYALPQDFFGGTSVEAIPFEIKRVNARAETSAEAPRSFAFDRLNTQVKWKSDLQLSQTEHSKVLRLTIDGDPTQQINRWQSYCQEQKRTVMYPYCLWYLSNMYLQLGKSISPDSQERNIANAYALEFAKAIKDSAEAPLYLRSLSNNVVESLLAGSILEPQFGDF